MSRTIWKFPLHGHDVAIQMSADARPLSVQVQQETPVLWAEVDPNAPTVTYRVMFVGTGHVFEPNPAASYVSTFQMYGGSLVLHAYIARE